MALCIPLSVLLDVHAAAYLSHASAFVFAFVIRHAPPTRPVVKAVYHPIRVVFVTNPSGIVCIFEDAFVACILACGPHTEASV